MSVLAEPLPDDPAALKALLLAERAAHVAETERLKQIIKELQRHRFGRRAESLPIDQLELALEEVQQGEAEDEAAAEAANPERRKAKAAKRRSNRGSLPAHLPRSSRLSTSGTRLAHAAPARCTGSARTSPSGST